MSSEPSPSTPRENILEALGGMVKEHSGVDSNPLDVRLADPLPNQVRFYLYNTSNADEDHGSAINVSLDNTNEEGHDITERVAGSEYVAEGEFQVILGGYSSEYDVFTFWDDALYSHYDNSGPNTPHKSYIPDEKLAEARANGLSVRKRPLGSRGERGGETVISVTPNRVDEALQMRDRIEWIRKQLHDELEDNWDENDNRAGRLEHLTYEYLAKTDRRKSEEERLEQALTQVHNLQDVTRSTVRDSIRSNVYGDHQSSRLTQTLISLLYNVEQMYFEKYNLWREPVVFEKVTDMPDTTGLYFEEDEARSQSVSEQIDAALRSGNHVILTGPPGSGKSDLAEQVADYYATDFQMATATDDWTTFDTIGGYRPQGENDLQFHPGLFLQRFSDKSQIGTRDVEAKNEWLIIDELNRANIDKAFGSLFSALTGKNVTLPFDDTTQEPTKPIKLIGNPSSITEPRINSYTYYIPEDWRLIATVNSEDKSSLYRMSRAFMRRFSFIPVPVPSDEDLNDRGEDLMEEYLNVWNFDLPDPTEIDGIEDEEELFERLQRDLSNFWYAVQQYQRVGPGVIKDVVEQTLTSIERTGELHYEYAIVAKLLPQLEGLPPGQMEDVLTVMDNRSADWFELGIAKEFTTEYLDIKVDLDDE